MLSRFPILSHENADVPNHRLERRGLLHCVLAPPSWERPLHAMCMHLSLRERGRRRPLDTLYARLREIASDGLPLIVAGDFNDWRERATTTLERELGLTEVLVAATGRHARTFPSAMPMLRLDGIYVCGFGVQAARAHRGRPWALLSDHLVISEGLARD